MLSGLGQPDTMWFLIGSVVPSSCTWHPATLSGRVSPHFPAPDHCTRDLRASFGLASCLVTCHLLQVPTSSPGSWTFSTVSSSWDTCILSTQSPPPAES